MFVDSLELKLVLTVSGTDHVVAGGGVKAFEVDLHSYGFICSVSFVISSEKKTDPLLSTFMKQDLMEASFSIYPHLKPPEVQMEPLTLKGLVTRKALLAEWIPVNVERTSDPVLWRHYRVEFADPARVLWRQHHPCDLLADKSVKDLIEAHKGSKVDLAWGTDVTGWSDLSDSYAVTALPLGIDSNRAAFYDFVMWFIQTRGGVWSYDCKENRYTISKGKSDSGNTTAINKLEVQDWRVDFPETIRNSANVLNASSLSPQKSPISQAQAVDGIYRDFLGCYPIASDFQKRQTMERDKLKVRGPEIHLRFCRFPLLTFRPGCLVKLEGGLWSDKIYPKGKVYRVRDISIKARPAKEELTADTLAAFAGYEMEMESRLEEQGEGWVSLPQFHIPVFPMYLEGKVLSETGESDDLTYQIYQDANTSEEQYKVTIPLFGNQKIPVALSPNFFPGHYYFPAYKNARVLVALDLHSASIERFLDWRSGARLTMDSQGNKILEGKSTSSGTYISHYYEDGKPVFEIQRTSDKDTQMIQLGEGVLIWETKQES